MKRKKLARIQQVQQSLVQIVGVKFGGEALAEVFREKFEEQPSLLASASFSTSLHTHESDNGKDDADLMEIHYQLREIPPVIFFFRSTMMTTFLIFYFLYLGCKIRYTSGPQGEKGE